MRPAGNASRTFSLVCAFLAAATGCYRGIVVPQRLGLPDIGLASCVEAGLQPVAALRRTQGEFAGCVSLGDLESDLSFTGKSVSAGSFPCARAHAMPIDAVQRYGAQ